MCIMFLVPRRAQLQSKMLSLLDPEACAKSYPSSYFAKYNPPYPYYEGNTSFRANGGVYNRNGRGIPDASTNGDNIAVFLEGTSRSIAGRALQLPFLLVSSTWYVYLSVFVRVKCELTMESDQRRASRNRQIARWIHQPCPVRESIGVE